MCNNTQKKKAAGAGKDFTLFFGVILHFNFKCVGFLIILRELENSLTVGTNVTDRKNGVLSG